MNKITQKQKDYILSLCSKLKPETVHEISRQWDLNNLDNFTIGQANNLIKVLKSHLQAEKGVRI
ncbi:hypothetical protein [Hydrogenivirga sp. 128-5-R1-1]|uniref:hypothetical protein n=1 Tax=Hydrogenivirga sp. 128-5-R1-1 TaxID=392423 RepID=UPI00015F130C|nr:hypothetical protein [Hydrogenivirga sp. 128-5-R1-1]EDP73741.1 hypothetical protein HG1285_11053 [Hydrogenivirga sp. 128-5-R1-1]